VKPDPGVMVPGRLPTEKEPTPITTSPFAVVVTLPVLNVAPTTKFWQSWSRQRRGKLPPRNPRSLRMLSAAARTDGDGICHPLPFLNTNQSWCSSGRLFT